MTDNNGLGVMLKMPLLTDSSGQTLSRTEADPKEGNSNQNQVVKTKRRIQRLKRRVKDPFNKKKIKNLKRRECVLEKVSRLFPDFFCMEIIKIRHAEQIKLVYFIIRKAYRRETMVHKPFPGQPI